MDLHTERLDDWLGRSLGRLLRRDATCSGSIDLADDRTRAVMRSRTSRFSGADRSFHVGNLERVVN